MILACVSFGALSNLCITAVWGGWLKWSDRRRLRREWREFNARSLSTLTRPLPDARPAQPDRRY